jgi:hypothetical protein
MMTITRVGPLSVAKVAGLLYVIMGLVFGAFISLAAMIGAFTANEQSAGMMGALFGVGAIILLPIFYGCLGFVMTLLMAWLFNVVAGIVGGVEIEAR